MMGGVIFFFTIIVFVFSLPGKYSNQGCMHSWKISGDQKMLKARKHFVLRQRRQPGHENILR
jgi:hypothetical protein